MASLVIMISKSWRGCVLALCLDAVVAVIAALWQPQIDFIAAALLLGAVFASAWFGGPGPGSLAGLAPWLVSDSPGVVG